MLGGGHSIGIPLAVSADYTFVAKVCNDDPCIRSAPAGPITAEPTFAYMIKTQERVVDFIVEHSPIARRYRSKNELYEDNMANDVGTLLFGPEAAEMGLVDRIGTLSRLSEITFNDFFG